MIRREFLKRTAILSAGTLVFPEIDLSSSKADMNNIGIQLYTVRDDMSKNPYATLRKIAELGYKHVESAGYYNGKFYGKTKEDFKAMLDDVGLKMWSGHTNTGFGYPEGTYSMTNKWEAVCEDAAFMGQKYIGCGYFSTEERKTIEDYKHHAALFNTCGEMAKKYNLTFFHHNHDFEFEPIAGVVPYDVLLNETDKNLVKFELDHYWTKKANVNSLKLMKKHTGRFPLWHIKDMDHTPARSFTEVGTGVIDYKAIFKSKAIDSLAFYFVEQDSNHNTSPLRSIEISFNNLRKLKV
ncbi:MAG: sugar phosphate isomerase/epimerase [Saprospiraceae bacterium]|nr:sugar phosphate isomerase/epimerase [Saprospiraceae bacterium]